LQPSKSNYAFVHDKVGLKNSNRLGEPTRPPVANTAHGDHWISHISEYPTSQPAVMLSRLLQAYINIDTAISQATSAESGHLSSTQRSEYDLDIIAYLAANDSTERWQEGFTALTQQYLEGILAAEAFGDSLERIMAAVQGLEEIQATVEQSLELELAKSGMYVTVSDSFWRSLDDRARTLEDAARELERALDV